MNPPGFIRYWDGNGVQRPHCLECIHYANEKFTMRGICWEYGAYVSLYSSSETFTRRISSNPPILDESTVKVAHKFGLRDLLR